MKKTFAFLTVTVLLIVSCGKKDVVHPTRRDLTQAVYASGKIFPKNDYKVFAKLSGYVQTILVHVGDTVHVGEALLTVRSDVSDINVQAAKNQLDLAAKNADDHGPQLSALMQDVNSSRSKYLLDSTDYSRYKNLQHDNAVSQLQVDQAKTLAESSKATYDKAWAMYSSSRDRLHTEYQNAKLQFDAQSSNRSDYTITAAVSGRVYDIAPKIGDLVGPLQPVMEIGDAKAFEVDLDVDETDVALVQKGQKIVYALDAYKGQEFTGEVVEQYPRISPGNKTSRVIATLTIPANMQLFSGMSVEANIIIVEKKNILVIPREYISVDNTVKVNGKTDPVKVISGIEDLEYVEILSGLTEDDELMKQ